MDDDPFVDHHELSMPEVFLHSDLPFNILHILGKMKVKRVEPQSFT